MKSGLVPKVMLTLLLIAVSLTTLMNCKRVDSGKSARTNTATNVQEPEYVGRENCKECHEKEYKLYQGSDHDMAMDTVNAETEDDSPSLKAIKTSL